MLLNITHTNGKSESNTKTTKKLSGPQSLVILIILDTRAPAIRFKEEVPLSSATGYLEHSHMRRREGNKTRKPRKTST